MECNIVLGVGLFGHSADKEIRGNMDEGTLMKIKEVLDDIPLRKVLWLIRYMPLMLTGYWLQYKSELHLIGSFSLIFYNSADDAVLKALEAD